MATLSFDRAAVAAASSFQVLVAVGPRAGFRNQRQKLETLCTWTRCGGVGSSGPHSQRQHGYHRLWLLQLVLAEGHRSRPGQKLQGRATPRKAPRHRRMLFGARWEKPTFSISGLWPAACARAASRERRRWSRFVRSPPHGHRTGPQCRHARGAHANQDLEKRAGEMQAKGFTWRRMQPGPRPQGPARAEGEPDSFQHLRWQHQLRDNCSVHRLRQLLLPKVGRRRDREGVSSGHHRINSPKSVIQWRNGVRI